MSILPLPKKIYVDNGKYLEANAQAMDTLKQTLRKEHTSLISYCDSAFAVWNTLTYLKEQASNNVERESIGDESDQACYMVQGNDSLEVTSDSHLDDCASSSNYHDSSMDAHALNEELSMFCEKLLSKYKALKNKSFEVKKKNETLFSKLDLVLKEKVEVSVTEIS